MNWKMKSRFSLLLTLLLTGIVIVAGVLSVSWLDHLIPNFKNQVVTMDNQTALVQLSFREEDISTSMYPWNTYDASKMKPLPDTFQESLHSMRVNSFLYTLFYGDKTDSFSDMEKRFQYNPDAPHMAFLKDAQIVSDKDERTYLVDCAVEEKLGMIYFHKQRQDQPKVSKEQLQRAYETMLKVQAQIPIYSEKYQEYDSEETYKIRDWTILDGYIELILLKAYSLAQTSMIEGIQMLTSNLYSGYAYSTEILTTENEVLFVVSFGEGIQTSSSLIFFFDPVQLEFIGFSIQGYF